MAKGITVMEQGLLMRIAVMGAESDEDGGDGTTVMNMSDALLPLHLSFVCSLRYDTLNPVEQYPIHVILCLSLLCLRQYNVINVRYLLLIRRNIKANVGLMWLILANCC
jgi:hypothetical protein